MRFPGVVPALLCVLVVGGCGGGSAADEWAQQSEEDAKRVEPVSPRFDWGESCIVPVRETISLNGHDIEVAYELSLTPDGTRPGWVLRMERFEVETINGGEPPLWLLDVAYGAGLFPELLIAPDGSLEDFGELPEPDSVSFPDVQLTEQMQGNGANAWDLWAGVWLLAGEIGIDPVERTADDGTAGSKPPSLRWENLGHVGDTYVRLRAELEAELRDEAAEPLVLPPTSHHAVYEVVTDPATLRPVRARLETDQERETLGGRRIETQDIRTFEFDWAAATGCS